MFPVAGRKIHRALVLSLCRGFSRKKFMTAYFSPIILCCYFLLCFLFQVVSVFFFFFSVVKRKQNARSFLIYVFLLSWTTEKRFITR